MRADAIVMHRGSDIDSAEARRCEPHMRFDASLNVVFVEHPCPVVLRTRDDLSAYFNAVERFWRSHCNRKVFFVVSYDGFEVDRAMREPYANHVQHITRDLAITVLRHGGSDAQRANSLLMTRRARTPAYLYASLDEALTVAHGIQSGQLYIRPV